MSVRWIAGSRYEITAQVVHDEPHAHVLDFGILAYHFIGIEDPEHQSHVGAWVTGEINLSVDPFFYFREPRKRGGVPIPDLHLDRARGAAENQEEHPQDGTDHAQVDKVPDLVRIEGTDAWGDVSKVPSYVLRCRMEPAP